MLGLIYIFLCFSTGWVVCSYAFPNLSRLTETSFDKRKITVSSYLIILPVWYITGTLALTWSVYLVAAAVAGITQEPLFIANAIVMSFALFAFIGVFYYRIIRRHAKPNLGICKDKKIKMLELLLLGGITTLALVLMWSTFYVTKGQLHIGVSVFSDFSPHVGMIRSFSYGNNFPTAYSHFGGEDIRYHFMFQFLAGNLEYLGLRIDNAFNIPSALSLISAFLLFYVLTVKLTGKNGAGILACLFFAFRSSKSFITYLSEIPKSENILQTLLDNTTFIGDTPNEYWGLWNLNVYCNQRHLAFGLAVMFFILILFLPHLYEMFEVIKKANIKKAIVQGDNHSIKKIPKVPVFIRLISYFRIIFISREAWLVKDLRLAIASGILLGSLSFFHGAVVIGCLLILFMLAILSRRRLEFAITAILALALSFLQTGYFIKGSAVSPEFLFGFIAENKTIFGVASYLGRLLGILPFVLLAALCFEKGVGRYIILAFTAPLVFAFTFSLTVDVTVNHKYIMMTSILLGCFAAALIIRLFQHKDMLLRLVGISLVIMLTGTGIYDFYTLLHKNARERGIILELDNPLTDFVRVNSDSKDLFLTANTNYTINQLVFGGGMLFEGHQYYAWSAGYDTNSRDWMVRRMYQAETPGELKELVKENNIRFIVVELQNRVAEDYIVNEENISAVFECVYWEGEGEGKLSIYDTLKLK
ncbi:MAG TPA: hypothetical protein VJ888_10220 [Mobilitalea sp.]|nr:hypothetical protein [Mobilitalea sp.]